MHFYFPMKQTLLKMALGFSLMALLSGCITVDCKDCNKCGGLDPDRPCPLINPPAGEAGVKCRFPGNQAIDCDISNPNHVCTDKLENGVWACKCLPPGS